MKWFEESGHKKSVHYLSEIVQDDTIEHSIRIAAATALAPYQYPKWQSTPSPRYIDTALDLPEPNTVDAANQQIAMLGTLLAKGELDLAFHDALVASRRAWIESKTNTELEARIFALEQSKALPPDTDDTPADPEPATADPQDPQNWGATLDR
jgi:hypothetical protein